MLRRARSSIVHFLLHGIAVKNFVDKMSEESSTNKLSNEGDLSSNLKEVSKPVDISTSGSHLHAKYKLISREFSRIYDAKIDKHITH